MRCVPLRSSRSFSVQSVRFGCHPLQAIRCPALLWLAYRFYSLRIIPADTFLSFALPCAIPLRFPPIPSFPGASFQSGPIRCHPLAFLAIRSGRCDAVQSTSFRSHPVAFAAVQPMRFRSVLSDGIQCYPVQPLRCFPELSTSGLSPAILSGRCGALPCNPVRCVAIGSG